MTIFVKKTMKKLILILSLTLLLYSCKKEEYLWVATSAMPEMEGYSNTLDGKAEILSASESDATCCKLSSR